MDTKTKHFIHDNQLTLLFISNMKPDRLYFVSCVCRCHAVNVCDNAAYFYEKINEDLRMGGLDVQAEDIIDIIEGYKGKGYAISSQEELGKCLILFWLL